MLFSMKITSGYLLAKALLVAITAEVIGSVITTSSVGTWYVALVKPALIPPGYVFGIVWGVLYVLIGLSLYVVWIAKKNKKKEKAVWIFYIQLALNVLWSAAFFGLRSPLLGLLVILFLLGSLIYTIFLFYKISKTAAYLLVPYLLWGFFATYLNWGVYLLNR